MRPLLVALLLPSLAACDRPTAPEARAIAQSFEQKFREGDMRGLTQMMMQTGTAGFLMTSRLAQNKALEFERSGERQRVNGIVVEDVIVAPGGIGRPRTIRTLLGWPDDWAFTVYAATVTHPGTVAARPRDYAPALQPSDVAVHFRDTTDWMPDISRNLLGRSGEVDIREGVVEQDCGTAKEPWPYPPDPKVSCHFASFDVEIRAEMTRIADSAALLRRPQHLRVRRQTIPGVRFVTQCPDAEPQVPATTLSASACQDVLQFWSHGDQYAPRLRIELESFHRTRGLPASLVRKTRRSAHDRPISPRWSVFAPDGRLVERDSIASMQPSQDAVDRVNLWSRLLDRREDDGRIVGIVPARYIDPRAPRYAVYVLDLEFSAAQ